MRVLLAIAVAAGLLWGAAAPAPVAAQASCEFVLGFATLRGLIPDEVGACLENAHYDAATGDALQRTTAWHGLGGLLVWRKADNWTAYTDGNRTWVNGPFGLQQRYNAQRFNWEQNPERLPIVPSPQAGDRCHTAGLTLSLAASDAGAGQRWDTYRLTNWTGVSCLFYGYPGAQLLDADNNPLPTNVVRGGGQTNDPGPATVVVPAGGSAKFVAHWSPIPVGNETTCPTASTLLVTPPDEWDALSIATPMNPCGGGTINVSALQPGP